MEREGSLHGPMGVCQHILVLQDIPIHIGSYLIVIVIVIITAYLLSSITRLLLL